MKLILDTHAFLWFINGSDRLSPTARELIEDPNNQRYIYQDQQQNSIHCFNQIRININPRK